MEKISFVLGTLYGCTVFDKNTGETKGINCLESSPITYLTSEFTA
jgi:hypothetical protein